VNIKAPQSFEDILKLQEILDNEIAKPRERFIPRKRDMNDINQAIVAEIIEFSEELPYGLNYKVWKEKIYNSEKQLEEFTDILFFIAAKINYTYELKYSFKEREKFSKAWDLTFEAKVKNKLPKDYINGLIAMALKIDVFNLVKNYIYIAINLNYSKQDIYDMYWKKWQKNMKRIDKDWSLKEKIEGEKMKQQLMVTLFEKRGDTNHVLGCKSYEIENNKITNELVKSFIRKIEITSERIFGKLTTVMKYELINGFTGIESTAAVDEHNYSEKIGAKILIDKVRNQIWYGLGFALGMVQVKEEPTIVSNNKDIMSEKINFGRALEFIKEGKRAARYGWNEKNMYIYLVEGKTENGITYNPHFAIKNVNQSVSTWVPSVNDCLADDWYIY